MHTHGYQCEPSCNARGNGNRYMPIDREECQADGDIRHHTQRTINKGIKSILAREEAWLQNFNANKSGKANGKPHKRNSGSRRICCRKCAALKQNGNDRISQKIQADGTWDRKQYGDLQTAILAIASARLIARL